MEPLVAAIKQLREITGAGIMDCRKAVESTGGDIERAIAVLKERGLLHAQERKDRAANEGRVFLKADVRKAALLHLACETDFVARTESFARLGEECLAHVYDGSAGEAELAQLIQEAAGRIKENLVLRSVKILHARENERLFSYLHGEGRIGAAVCLFASDPTAWERPELESFANDLALHIAAFAPLYLSRDTVDPAYLEAKNAEFAADARALGKPDEMLPRIAHGKIEKHLFQVCLLEQGFIRNETSSVAQALGVLREQCGSEIRICGFLYTRVGV